MGRRRELGSIASGIIGSFCSRNNDVSGYWAIGKLYKYIEFLEPKHLSIDLQSKNIEPYSPSFDLMIAKYSEMLLKLLSKRDIPSEWVNAAHIRIEFEADYQHRHHHWRSALGKPCNLVCVLVDDKGKCHVARSYTNCFPHDPEREIKSTRSDNV
ncbi:hypothetical protein L4174_009475 [Photobacterium sp. CCB-ST2H9]|uniref:hypothetical protein n=1 Tax=Photobacterium sp. CCB-ST2H9 TaxID=2912855 RepID=UPI0020061A14|nr:hypothetical protein [Photobacterium sp. CCB-ST2H9]UTM58926.1 hypothetical protein L4174_009475 [Photobacterium sp. CCB-ST2H9]